MVVKFIIITWNSGYFFINWNILKWIQIQMKQGFKKTGASRINLVKGLNLFYLLKLYKGIAKDYICA